MGIFKDHPYHGGGHSGSGEGQGGQNFHRNDYRGYYQLKKNRFREAAVSIAKQAGMTAAIFSVLFVFLNWSALSQVASWEYQKSVNPQLVQNSVLQEVVKPKETPQQKPLPLQTNIILAKKEVPDLNLTVTPPDTRIVIPRINKNIPIVDVDTQNLVKRDWNALEKDMQKALQYGVIHYPGTAKPGTPGNIVITGHSSYFPWDSGRFKDVFALLHDLQTGDAVAIYSEGKKYIYKVDKIYKINPSDLKILEQTRENRLTLMTCTPIGTNLKRLVIEARLMTIE
jgi:LPXTG-site transpeptidase (sortase) family protein